MWNQKIKAAWVAKLRSGEYTQHYRSLRGPDNCRCAVGVLAEVLCEFAPSEFSWTGHRLACPDYYNTGFNKHIAQVPEKVLPLNAQSKIFYMNDSKEFSFEQIADFIEATDW